MSPALICLFSFVSVIISPILLSLSRPVVKIGSAYESGGSGSVPDLPRPSDRVSNPENLARDMAEKAQDDPAHAAAYTAAAVDTSSAVSEYMGARFALSSYYEHDFSTVMALVVVCSAALHLKRFAPAHFPSALLLVAVIVVAAAAHFMLSHRLHGFCTMLEDLGDVKLPRMGEELTDALGVYARRLRSFAAFYTEIIEKARQYRVVFVAFTIACIIL